MSFGFPLGFPKGTAAVAPTQVLLLHMNGTNGSTTFLDATLRHTPAVSGTVNIATGQSKFGGAAGLGAGGYVYLGGSTDFNFGAGDFTVDFWMRATDANATFSLYRNSSSGYPAISLGGYRISVDLSSGTIQSAALSVSNNTWYHVAVTRSAGTTRLFLGGIEEASAADSGNYATETNYPRVFHSGVSGTDCYIDELQVLKGSATWTTGFTPPAAAYTPTDPTLPANTVAPAVTGTLTVGQVLSTTDGTWTGTPTPTYTYQWFRSPSTAIGTNSSSYTLVSADAGGTIYCRVTATNAAGSVNANSNTTAAISQLPANTVAPAVTGTTTEGQTLTTTTGTWTGTPTPAYTYQWYRSPSTAIGSATATTYVLAAGDVGNTIFCRVTATNTAGAVSADSNTTATITAPSTNFVLLTSTTADGGPSEFTTAAIDTTGADFLVVGVGYYSSGWTITDNKSNTWTGLLPVSNTDGSCRFFYCIPSSVGSGHTVTLSPGAYASLTFAAFSRTLPGSVLDAPQTTGIGSSATASAGAGLTPSTDDALVLALVAPGTGATIATAISGGFTILGTVSSVGFARVGHALAYQAQTTAAAVDPEWTLNTDSVWAASIIAMVPTEAETAAWEIAVTAAGGTVSTGRRVLVNNLIVGLKADGVWTKLDRLWVMAAENTQSALFELKTATNTTTFTGAPPFTVNSGYACYGAGGYSINLGFMPGTHGVQFTQNSAHMGIWTLLEETLTDHSITDNPPSTLNIYVRYSGDLVYSRINENSSGGFAVSTATGFTLGNRSGAAAQQIYKNGTSIASYAVGSYPPSTNDTTLWRQQFAAISFGASLNSTEQLALYNRLRTYMTAVGVP